MSDSEGVDVASSRSVDAGSSALTRRAIGVDGSAARGDDTCARSRPATMMIARPSPATAAASATRLIDAPARRARCDHTGRRPESTSRQLTQRREMPSSQRGGRAGESKAATRCCRVDPRPRSFDRIEPPPQATGTSRGRSSDRADYRTVMGQTFSCPAFPGSGPTRSGPHRRSAAPHAAHRAPSRAPHVLDLATEQSTLATTRLVWQPSANDGLGTSRSSPSWTPSAPERRPPSAVIARRKPRT